MEPTIEGPITTGTKGGPFGASLVDLDAAGYVEEEYFLTGEATTYRPVGELLEDGRWSVEAAGTMPYRTRFLVRRPVDRARFAGTVTVGWNNVSAGFDFVATADDPAFLESGAVAVGVTPQAVGVHGYAADPQGLAAWDPDRYGDLSIPDDDASYDIFTQAARAVGRERPTTGIDPLAGLEVRRVVATGGSQSAARLLTYYNAIEPVAGAFDGFLLLVGAVRGTPIASGLGVKASSEAMMGEMEDYARWGLPAWAHTRDDLGKPAFVVHSESEAVGAFPCRHADHATYCFWEVAGAPHASSAQRGIPSGVVGTGASTISWAPVSAAAARLLDRWIDDGTRPPSMPPIEMTDDPPTIVRDEHGIAKGGVRLPEVEVPIATVSAEGPFPASLIGSCEPFSEEELRRLYPDHAVYVDTVRAAAERAVAAGVLLPIDATDYVARAEAMKLYD